MTEILVRTPGLEPGRLAAQPPQDCVSTIPPGALINHMFPFSLKEKYDWLFLVVLT